MREVTIAFCNCTHRKMHHIVFADAGRISYARNEGFRTPKIALPFKVLGQFSGEEIAMARWDTESSEELFRVLEDWEDTLKDCPSIQNGGPRP